MIVPHEAIFVEFVGSKLDLNDVVVSVQPCALVIGGQMAQLVRGGEMKLLGDAVHQRTSSAEKRLMAACQKSGSAYSVGSSTPAR
ncbi:hypothetical protein D3C87_1816980 [compost metagenome]